jgi:hypothetical protein
MDALVALLTDIQEERVTRAKPAIRERIREAHRLTLERIKALSEMVVTPADADTRLLERLQKLRRAVE